MSCTAFEPQNTLLSTDQSRHPKTAVWGCKFHEGHQPLQILLIHLSMPFLIREVLYPDEHVTQTRIARSDASDLKRQALFLLVWDTVGLQGACMQLPWHIKS